MGGMTKKLIELLQQTVAWPEEAQDELADAIVEISASLKGDYHASADELAGIDRGIRDADAGLFATEDEVKAALNKFRNA